MSLGLLPMETDGGGYTPPGVEDFLWDSVWPGVLPDWMNKPFFQAVIGAALVIILWWIASRRLKTQPSKAQFAAEYIYEFIRNGAVSYFHQTCTAKMGRDSMSVVDAKLKVYGIEGLRIADGSIMPRLTTGNTMAPCVLIGERMAEILKA